MARASRPNDPGHPRMVRARERQAQAVQMRMAGATYVEIAASLDYRGRQGAQKAVQHAMQANVEIIEEERAMELVRLDRLQRAIWPQAINGDLQAIDRVLKISDIRAKLLGLNKPIKVDITERLREEAERFGLDPAVMVAAAQEIIAEHR